MFNELLLNVYKYTMHQSNTTKFFTFFYYLGINKQQLTIAYNNEQESPQDYVSNNRILKPIIVFYEDNTVHS